MEFFECPALADLDLHEEPFLFTALVTDCSAVMAELQAASCKPQVANSVWAKDQPMLSQALLPHLTEYTQCHADDYDENKMLF